jgi:hypothetical protein
LVTSFHGKSGLTWLCLSLFRCGLAAFKAQMKEFVWHLFEEAILQMFFEVPTVLNLSEG